MLHNLLHELVWAASCILILSVCGALLCGPHEARGEDWPQFGGPTGNWVSLEKGWRTNWREVPPPVWRVNLADHGGSGSSVAVVQDRVYATGRKGSRSVVYCLDSRTGAILWQNDQIMAESVPAVDSQRLFVCTALRGLACLNAGDGQRLWLKIDTDLGVKRFPGRDRGVAVPILDVDSVLIDAGSLVSVEKATGNVRWIQKVADPVASAPVLFALPGDRLAGVRLAAVFSYSGLEVFDRADGRAVAQLRSLHEKFDCALAQQEQVLVADSGGSQLYRLKGSSLSIVWKKVGPPFYQCVLWDGHLYGMAGDALACVAFRSGEQQWSKAGLGNGSRLAIVDGKVLIQTARGELVLAEASPQAYRELARMKVTEGPATFPPVLSGGRIYCSSLGGDLVCVDLGAPTGAAAVPPTGGVTASAVPPAPDSVDGLKANLMTLAAKGKLDLELVKAFERYSDAKARAVFVPGFVSKDAWDEIARNPVLREGLLVGLAPAYHPNVVQIMQGLRQKFGPAADAHPHLVLAFAFAWAGGPHAGANWECTPQRKQGRPVPAVEQSFAYYLQREPAMRTNLRDTPWPILAYIADNEVPLDEREWALKQYANLLPDAFQNTYSDVDFNTGKFQGRTTQSATQSLPSIARLGGVCVDQAYFSSRVLKCLGVPALYCAGEGKDCGHAWLVWVHPEGGSPAGVRSAGRYDFGKYYTGEVYCPVADRVIHDFDVCLMMAAIRQSYRAYLDGLIAAHVYDLAAPEERATVIGLLKAAADRSPFCTEPWRRLARAAADGVMPESEGEQLCAAAFRTLASQPDLTFEVLEKVMLGRFNSAAGKTPQGIQQNLAILERAFQEYERVQRPDLSVKLRGLHGRYLVVLGRPDDAVAVLAAAAQQYADKHYGFLDLVDCILEIKGGQENRTWRVGFLRALLQRVPVHESMYDRLQNVPSRSCCRIQALLQAESAPAR